MTSEEILDLAEDRIFALLQGENSDAIIARQDLGDEDEDRVATTILMANIKIDWDDDYVA